MQDFIYESALKLGEELKKNRIIENIEKSLKIVKISG